MFSWIGAPNSATYASTNKGLAWFQVRSTMITNLRTFPSIVVALDYNIGTYHRRGAMTYNNNKTISTEMMVQIACQLSHYQG